MTCSNGYSTTLIPSACEATTLRTGATISEVKKSVDTYMQSLAASIDVTRRQQIPTLDDADAREAMEAKKAKAEQEELELHSKLHKLRNVYEFAVTAFRAPAEPAAACN